MGSDLSPSQPPEPPRPTPGWFKEGVGLCALGVSLLLVVAALVVTIPVDLPWLGSEGRMVVSKMVGMLSIMGVVFPLWGLSILGRRVASSAEDRAWVHGRWSRLAQRPWSGLRKETWRCLVWLALRPLVFLFSLRPRFTLRRLLGHLVVGLLLTALAHEVLQSYFASVTKAVWAKWGVPCVRLDSLPDEGCLTLQVPEFVAPIFVVPKGYEQRMSGELWYATQAWLQEMAQDEAACAGTGWTRDRITAIAEECSARYTELAQQATRTPADLTQALAGRSDITVSACSGYSLVSVKGSSLSWAYDSTHPIAFCADRPRVWMLQRYVESNCAQLVCLDAGACTCAYYTVYPQYQGSGRPGWRGWFKSEFRCLAALLAAALLLTAPFFYLRPRRTEKAPADEERPHAPPPTA